jgi:hypothetical protein
MKVVLSLAMVALVAMSSIASAAELKSGPQSGDDLLPFTVEKCAGAADDGVKEGSKLCYRCKLGDRPMVMVFSRKADDKLAKLVTKLDKTVQANADAKLGAFVSLIGSDADELKTAAKGFEKNHKAGSVAIVVPLEQPNGPKDYKLSEDADVTVIVAKDGKVSANYAMKADKLDDKAIDAIIADAKKLVK